MIKGYNVSETIDKLFKKICSRVSLIFAKIAISLLFILFSISTQGATITSTTSGGNWNATATWVGGVVPISTDDVVMGTNATVIVTADATCGTLTFTASTQTTTLTINSGITLTVTGAVTINRSNGSGMNALAVGAGNLNAGSLSFASAGQTSRHKLSISTGTATISGDVTQSGTQTSPGIEFTGAGKLRLGGSFLSSTTCTLTPSTGTIEYYASGAQTVGVFTTYNNLILSGSGAKTTSSIKINGILSMEGTATATGTAPTFGTAATLKYNGTGAQTSGIEFPTTWTGTGGVLIANTSGNAVTLAANKTINSSLSINTGAILNLGTGLTHTSKSLYLAGVAQSTSTSYGGTGSAATSKNPTYFAASTGILNNGLCSAGDWTGAVNSDWGTSGNWCNNTVPTSSTNVTINSGGNQPVINGAAVCNNITINSGASLTISGINTLTVSGTWTKSGTFTPNTSTVIFNGTSQSISSTTTFNNLTLATSGTKTIANSTTTTVNGVLSMEGSASLTVSGTLTYGAAATLQYNTASTKTTGSEWPSTFNGTGGVIIANTGEITLGGSKILGNNVPLTINSGASLNTSASNNRSLTLGGNFTKNGTLTANASNITISGTATSQTISGFTTTGTVSMTKTAGTATLTGAVSGGALTISGAGGTLNLGTSLSHTFTGVLTLTNGTLNGGTSSTLNLSFAGTAVTGTGATYTASTGTVNYSGAAQTMGVLTYNNLTLSGSGIKTFNTGTTTVNGVLSIENGSNANTFTGTLAYGANATLQYNSSSARTASTEWPSTFAATGGVIVKNTGVITMGAAKNFNNDIPLNIQAGATLTPGSYLLTLGGNFTNSGTFTSGSGGVKIAGTATSQTIGGFTTTGTVSMTKTAGTATFTGNVNGAGFTVNGSGGTLDLGSLRTHTFTGDWTRTAGTVLGNTSSLIIAGTVTNTAGTFTAGTGSVTYNGSLAQTIANVGYYNLILNGTNTVTFPAAITIANDLSFGGSAVANLGAFNSSTNTLTFGSTKQSSGSWGSTASSATNKLATYFGASATGLLNVIASCIAGTWNGNTNTDWNTTSNWCNSTVPTSTTDVTIPSGGNQPAIGAAGGTCRNITISSGAILTISGSNTLTISGDWINNGGTFTPNTSSVIFNSTAADQYIRGSAVSQTFYKLTTAKSSTKLVLNIPTTISNTLTMTSGNIDASTNLLQLGTSTSAVGTLTYTAGNILGNFQRWIASPGALQFPLGTETTNNNALVTFTNLTAGSLTASFTPTDAGWNNTSSIIDSPKTIDAQFSEGYWTLTAANSLASTNYSLNLTGNGFTSYTEDNTVRIIQRANSGANWAANGSHSIAGYSTPTAMRTGLSSFGQFTHGHIITCNLSATVGSTNTTCGIDNGTISISNPSGASAYEYRLDSGNWGSNSMFNNLAATTYSVQIRDLADNSCFATLSSTAITQPTSMTLGVAVNNVSCFANGNIAITATGGMAPITYDWADLPGTNNAKDRPGVVAGTYSLIATDANHCTAATGNLILAPPVGGCTGIDVCKSDAAKVFSVDPDPEVTAYTWTVPAGAIIVNGQNTSSIKVDFNAVAVGSYQVKVTATNVCNTSSETILTVYVIAPNATASVLGAACINGNLQLSATGGQSYSWSGPNGFSSSNVNPTIYNAQSPTHEGTYQVVATDQNGCAASASVLVALNDVPTEATTILAATCGNSTGSIDLTPSTGAPFTFLWSNGATSEDISSVPSGNYKVTITNSSGCSIEKSYVVANSNGPTISVDLANDVTCANGNNGEIQISVSGGTGPFTYSWTKENSNYTNDSQNISGLSAGTYNLVVTDASNCTASANATIIQPNSLNLDKILTPINCFGASTGAINITASGGTAPYAYNWGGGISTEDRSSIVAGNYAVSLTDANGCTLTDTYQIEQPASALTKSLIIDHITCHGSVNGLINLSVSGGTAPYTYSWTGPSTFTATTQDITSLAAGSYNVTISDAKGCSTGTTGTVTEPTALSASKVQTNISCKGGANGSITATISGGTAPYAYLWSNGAVTKDLSGLMAGIYTLTVTDQNGCTATVSATITEPAGSLAATISAQTNVSCYAGSNGSATVNVSGGTAAYSYVWGSNAASQTTATASGLGAGLYTVTITDANSCTTSASATITQPTVLSVSGAVTPVICNGASTGAINITAAGGTGSLSYNWGGGVTSEDRSSISAGNYQVTISDANNCSLQANYVVSQTAAISSSSSSNNITCRGSNNGSVDLTVSGGAFPYSFAWTGPNAFAASSQNISNLAPGTYAVTITDANTCTSTLTANALTQPAANLSVSATPTAVSCKNGTNGSIVTSASGGTAPYTYAWSTGATSTSLTGLIAGTYNLTVTDHNGCTAIVTATVSEPLTQMNLFANITNSSSCGTATGQIELEIENGNAPFNYVWTHTSSTQPNPDNLAANTYTATVTDAIGCVATKTIIVGTAPALSAAITTFPKSCLSNDGSAYAIATGGVAPYTYLWNNGAITPDITGLAAGNYSVTITDANGCTATQTETVTSASCSAPVAVNDQYSTNYNTLLNGNVSTNDSDPDAAAFPGSIMQFFNTSDPTADQGVLNWGAGFDGTFTFAPAAGYSGTFTIGYKVFDVTGLSATGNLTITVGPHATTDPFGTSINTAVNGDVSTNDIYQAGSIFTKITNPLKGSVVLNTNGTFTYTPNLNATGDDSFTYQVCLPAPNGSFCSSASVLISIDGQADVQLTKTVNQATPNVSSNVIFTLTASNNGPNLALGVVVTDALPSGYTYVSDNGAGAYNLGTGTWTAGSIANGASKSLAITANVLATGNYTNSASVTSSNTDPNLTNNTVTRSTTPVPQSDISVTKSVNNASQIIGQNVIYTLTVTNNGPSNATGVSLTDVLPSGLTYISNTAPSAGSFVSGTGVWTIGNLANGASATLTITARIENSGGYTNTATVTSSTADPSAANNTAQVTLTPGATADLRILKTIDNLNPYVGGYIEFTLNAKNLNGPSSATGVKVTDLLPSGYTYSSDTGSGSYDPVTGVWTIGSMAINATSTLKIRAQVNSTGSYTNTATIASNDLPDPDLSNNSASLTATVVPLADLAITEFINTSSPLMGNNVTISIVVTNNGLSNSSGVVASELLPSGYTYVSSIASSGNFVSGTGVWTIGNLANGASATLTLVATVNNTGTYNNPVSVTATTADLIIENNSDTKTINPVPVIVITNPAAVCAPATVNLSSAGITAGSSPNLTYSYWTDANATLSYSTPTAALAGTYYIKGTTINGGFAIAPVITTINPTPVVTFTTNGSSVCVGSTGNVYTTQTGKTNYVWSVSAGGTITAGGGTGDNNATIAWNTLGAQSVAVSYTNNLGCSSGITENTTITSRPVAPSLSLTHPTCASATGTITVTSPANGAGITYTVTGTNPVVGSATNASGIFSGLNPGIYDVSVSSGSGCTSLITAATINARPPIPTNPVATITQPTLALNTGTITITSPANGAGITYTLAGITPVVGAITNSTGNFNGLNPGDYTIIASNGSGCSSSATSLTITDPPLPPVPPILNSIIQPSCTTATGTISIASPVPGAGVSYTVTGTNPIVTGITNTTGVFAGLNPGDYSITTTNATGITSSAITATINAQPITPQAPTVIISLAPTCSVKTGSLSVTSGLAGLSLSLNNGAFTNTTGLYSLLNPGTYVITAKNAAGCISTATTKTILAVSNCAPIAGNDTISTLEDTPISSNASNHDTLSGDGHNDWTIIGTNGGALHGTVTMALNGSFTYTPNLHYYGADQFTYNLCDGSGNCSSAIVAIKVTHVNHPPVALPDNYTVINGSTLTATVAQGLLSNDTDQDGDPITAIKVTNPTYGTLTFNSNGSFSYLPDGVHPTDSFTYKDSDGTLNGNTATVTISIIINHPPIGVNTQAIIDEDGTLRGPSLLSNFTDPDGNTLTLNTAPTIRPIHGSLTISSNGTYTYIPDPNYNGSDTFSYEVCDNGIPVMCATAKVTITVNSVNDLPLSKDDSFVAHIDSQVSESVAKNDVLSGDGGNTWSVVTQPAKGTLLFNPDGTFTYKPTLSFNGIDSFTYKLCDSNGDCTQATVNFEVNDVVIANQIFTPNNDGQNDTFTIAGIELYPNNSISIFNRWGNLVYQKSGYKNEWDGYSNLNKVGNSPLPIGTYFYVLNYGYKQHKTGFIYLER